MKKKTVISVMVVAMLFAVSLFFVGGTYARYAGEFTGDASVNVAKWAVKVNEQEETNLDLTFEVASNKNVVANKIAPSLKAVAPVTVDLNGTEVAVDLVVEKGDQFDEKIKELGFTKGQLKFSVKQSPDNVSHTTGITGDGSTTQPFVIPLQGEPKSAFTEENGSVKVEVTLEWENNDENNAEDTTVGKTKNAIILPVKLSVKQHIDEE